MCDLSIYQNNCIIEEDYFDFQSLLDDIYTLTYLYSNPEENESSTKIWGMELFKYQSKDCNQLYVMVAARILEIILSITKLKPTDCRKQIQFLIPFIADCCFNPPICRFKLDGCQEDESSFDYIRKLSLQILYNINDEHFQDIILKTSPKNSELRSSNNIIDFDESAYIPALTSYILSENQEISLLSRLILDNIAKLCNINKLSSSLNQQERKSPWSSSKNPFNICRKPFKDTEEIKEQENNEYDMN